MSSTKTRVIEVLLERLENGDEVDRCYAAQTLGRLKAESAFDSLYQHLRDEDLDVCVDAAEALGRIGNADAVQGLIDALHYHSEADVKQAAVEGLSRCGGSLAMAQLRKLLYRCDDIVWSETDAWDDWWDLQLMAVTALGRHRHVDAVPNLVELLDSEEGQDIESQVLTALVKIGPAGLERLQQRLGSANHRHLRRIALALRHGEGDQVQSMLRQLLDHSAAEVRCAAVETLVISELPDRAQLLVQRLKDVDSQVQAAALRGFPKLNTDLQLNLTDELLLLLFDSPDSDVRCAALNLLGARMAQQPEPLSDALVERLRAGLQSDREEEQRLSCELLAQIDDDQARVALQQLGCDIQRPLTVRRLAIQALGKQTRLDESLLQALWQCSQDRQAPIRHVALQTLLELRSVAAEDQALPTPLSLLLQVLDGSEAQWPSQQHESEQPQAEAEVESEAEPEQVSQAEGMIPVMAVDADGNPEADNEAPKGPMSMEQILASMSDAYPEPVEPSAEPNEPDSPKSFGSTLEAISHSNIEAAVGTEQTLSDDSNTILDKLETLPSEYQGYAEVVRENARTGERMLQQKRRKPEDVETDRRRLAVRVLGDSQQADVVQPLLSCLMDEDPELRREAADSLGRLAEFDPKLEGLGSMMGPVATQLRAGNEEIRLACARTLGALQHRAAVPALLAALQDPDTLVRIQAIRSLVAVSLARRPVDEHDHVVLSEITPDKITTALLECRSDSEIGVRQALIEALKRLRVLDLDLMLSLGLEEGGALTRSAATTLRELAPEQATEALIARLGEIDDSMIRRLVIQMLELIHLDADAA